MIINQFVRPVWTIRQSIAMELDLALAMMSGPLSSAGAASPAFTSLFKTLPPGWMEEWQLLTGEMHGFHSPLETLAVFADVMFETDYRRASTAMRELTVVRMRERLSVLSARNSLIRRHALESDEGAADTYVKLQMALFKNAGVSANTEYQRTLRSGFIFVQHVIQGGNLHRRFWDWIDRFFFEVYAPWRAGRLEILDELEKQAAAFLDMAENTDSASVLSRLPRMNPVLRQPGVKKAVEEGRLPLFLWVEPFSMPDAWTLLPDGMMSTFAHPGAVVDDFTTFTGDLAGRLAALSDPTRLFILRLIRNIDMTNTDMAEYLNLSRPTVSIHARVLREAGLIRSHPVGRAVRHEIVSEAVHKLFRDLEIYLDLPVDK